MSLHRGTYLVGSILSSLFGGLVGVAGSALVHCDKDGNQKQSEQLKKILHGYNTDKDENNNRFYKTALEQYSGEENQLCIHTISWSDGRRIFNPPTTLINTEDMKSATIKISDEEAVKIKYLQTKHGIYVKLSEPVCNGSVEHAFGFGSACSGFNPDKIVYYPNHEQKIYVI